MPLKLCLHMALPMYYMLEVASSSNATLAGAPSDLIFDKVSFSEIFSAKEAEPSICCLQSWESAAFTCMPLWLTSC